MFRILVLDKRDSILTVLKYLLYRYEVMFSHDVDDAVNKLKEDNVDMILINLPLENGSMDVLREWTREKKTIALVDMLSPDMLEESSKLGALECVDKLDIPRLPELVSRHLNQAATKVLVEEMKQDARR